MNHKTFHASSGLLNLNKPIGLTSDEVVARLRRLTGQRRIGHAGTLDPLATGVLLVCLGQATRLIEYVMTGQKQYRAVIRFGLTTATLDAEGPILTQADPSGLTETYLQALLPRFVGEIQQIPPIYSALKKEGRPLYKRARAGENIEVEPRPVTIQALTWVEWQSPNLTLDITCSPGTYIRSLARDLGEVAGVGAYLAGLGCRERDGRSYPPTGVGGLPRPRGQDPHTRSFLRLSAPAVPAISVLPSDRSSDRTPAT